MGLLQGANEDVCHSARSLLQDIGPRYSGVLLGMSNTGDPPLPHPALHSSSSCHLQSGTQLLSSLTTMLFACWEFGWHASGQELLAPAPPPLPSAPLFSKLNRWLFAAGVLAGVLGTAATGYILKNGTWDQVWSVAVSHHPPPSG